VSHSLISDPDWLRVNSKEFDAKFLKHEMPVVRKLANDYKDMMEIVSENDESAADLQYTVTDGDDDNEAAATESAAVKDPFANLSETAAA
jgi:hypothetical protein